ncbi:MAG: helix-turn-helix transcriptional regulator [Ruminococcaceae bacterium]|nr:helix-turn-helix transcriptional regulator [Oscillospiraceae bacterium]
MISYKPLWRTMKERGVTTYTLIYKNGFSAYTITSLRRNKSITMNTLEKLCTVLDCTPNDIIEFVNEDQA